MQAYPLTLPSVFRRAERIFPTKTVTTVEAGRRVRTTYGEWAARTRKLGGALDTLGVSADGRVGTFAWNTARHLELYFAAPCTGRVLHTLNIRLFPEQLAWIVNHAEDEVIFADRSLLGVLWPLIDELKSVRHVVVMDDTGGEGGEDIPVDPRIVDYEELVEGSQPASFDTVSNEDQAAAMCYTSGTTGKPKGVVYSHRSVVLHSMASLYVDTNAICEADVNLPVVPMFHANAWGICQASVLAGSSLILPGRDLSPPAVVQLLLEEGVTMAAGVPTVWMGVLPELGDRRPPALNRILCGGSAVPRSLAEAYRTKFGVPIIQAWGMTETSPVASMARVRSDLSNRPEDELTDLRATQGYAVPGMELRIVSPEGGEELPWDGKASGELQARGPWVAASYYNDPTSASSFTDDGWLRTGDVATVSPEGYIRLVDRTKDLIKSGGEWISSVDLENEIMAHPKVAEAAVIAIPNERWMERPLACVVVKEGETVTAEEVRAWLEPRVAKWWLPDEVVFIDEVPKTSVGKFSKRQLRDRFANQPAKP
jgi:fatty-acyl-CoA synthase